MTGTQAASPRPLAINPFLLPASGDSPVRPLCPWNVPDHDHYYVPINHTDDAFTEFILAMGDLSGLRTDGKFVFVTGESGCGKTSLINRCAAWVSRTAQDGYLRNAIIDLTREGNSGPQRSVVDRMNVVCRRLLDELITDKLLDHSATGELADRCERPDLFYPFLSNVLPDDTVLTVLLPPTDELAEEIVRYAALARRKLIFFAESAYLTQDQIRRRSPELSSRPTVLLQVGPLRAGDVRRFVSDRLERLKKSGEFPGMDVETMELAAGPLRSIAMVQRILYGVYEHRRRNNLRYTAADRVTYEDITRFFYEEYQQQLRVGR